MGIYDREYSREAEPGYRLSAPQSATVQMVVLTAGVYLLQLAFPQVRQTLALRSDWFRQPWQCYQLLTYGFLHDPQDIKHILFNMLVLWMVGRDIEARYGKREFLSFYLTAIVFSGAVWSASEAGFGSNHFLLGASGGISGLFVLYALNFPHRQVLFMFAIPMPMWMAALIVEAIDIYGAMDRSGNVACIAHLAGALFGLYYYKFEWSLAGLFSRLSGNLRAGPKPHLRVHEPDEEDDLSRKVDEILQKIQEQGQDSLTWNERRLLEKASRRYQEKRK